MAKKKFKFHKRYIWIPSVAIAGVLIAVFVFGIGVPNIAPASDDFPVNFPQFIDCSTPGAILNPKCEFLTALTTSEMEDPTISILCIQGFIRVGNDCVLIENPDAIQCMTGSTDPNCAMPINGGDCCFGIDDPPISSDNSTTTQVCDELDISSCGTSPLSLTTLITKIDSQGNKTFTTNTLQLSGLSFFIEEGTSIDYSTGFIELEAKALSSENLGIVGTGLLDVLINNQTILTDLVLFSIDGKGCEIEPCPVESCNFEEECNFRFDTDSVFGVFSDVINNISTSPIYKFSFEEHFDKFPDSEVSTLEFVIKSLDFTLEDGKKFGESQFNVFTLQIDKDPNLFVIINEEGMIEKVFPTDTLLTYANGGQTQYSRGNCTAYWSQHMGTIEIFDSEGVSLGSAALPSSICSVQPIVQMTVTLTRDDTYRLVHTPNIATDPASSTDFDITFTTPKSQKNYSLQCYRSQSDGFYCNYPSADGSEIIRVGTCGACQ